jgi:CRISPR/Cas system CMR subunit Cmr4 (Cas7 group RAMP superfamily)
MNTHRYIARFIVEADTPLFVGSGEASLITDALVQRDFNGLPMIYGTSLAGVLRHSLEDFDQNNEVDWKDVFGYQDKNKGKGSRIKISNAYMMLNENRCAEGLQHIQEELIKRYQNLPVRQHVRINDRGAAEKGGLFDNEICYKGTRFIFEIELSGNNSDKQRWKQILHNINHPAFRIGQGTRNGYGQLKVIKSYEKIFNLTLDEDFNEYTQFDPSLNAHLICNESESNKPKGITEYKLVLKPDSLFFNFSSGYGDNDVDNTPLTEEVATYSYQGINFIKQTVIPASSIKGALSHRVCFHYNKLKGNFAESIALNEKKLIIGSNNQAVFSLFGGESSTNTLEIDKTCKEGKPLKKQRGKVIISDSYYSDINNEKILNHVAIDRFTGGGMDGALFSEKVSYRQDGMIEFNLYLESICDDDERHISEALKHALIDICKGLLPLGGMTTKGHGIFVGTLFENGKKIFEYGE